MALYQQQQQLSGGGQPVYITPYEQYQLLQQQQSYLGQGSLQDYDLTPADTEWFMQPTTDEDGEINEAEVQLVDRLAETALSSWGFEKTHFKRVSSRLSLSGRGGSDIDLKNFLARKGKPELTGLYKAASKGDTNSIMNFVKREGLNAPLNTPDENGCTPLMYAALSDSLSAIEMLLNFSVRREQTDDVGRTAVHYAAFFGKHKALKFLIESGSDWTPRDAYGRTPLHWTSTNKNTKCLLALLEYARIVNGNINPQDNEGMTPVHCAAQYGATKHVIMLDEAGCNFTKTDIEGKTAVHWTVDNIDGSCLHAIVDRYPHLLNKQDSNGHTILHLASYRGNVNLVDELLSITGIEINTRDKEDHTPMHLAAIAGHSRVIELLVIFRALDSCIDSNGLTALHYAVQFNAVECVKVLAASGFTTHVPSADDKGVTPLILAAELGFNEVLKALLKNPMIAEEINQCDHNGYSALHYTTNGGFHNCVATLLKYGSDPNIVDKSNLSPLDIACERGHHLCIEPLVKGGANVDNFDDNGFTVIHRAILNQQSQVVNAFVGVGCDFEKMDSNGRTPLQLTVYTGNEEILALILPSVSNPNEMDLSGLTPMHVAAMEGHIGILKLLLKNGGYINNMDGTENKHTPLDYAKQSNQSECIKLLEENAGLTVNDIKTIAAVCIQSLYRKYRARKVLDKKKCEKIAAICIQRHIRGFIQRKRFQNLQKQQMAAIIIQSTIRGFIARRTFKKQLQKYREEKDKKELIERFGNMLLDIKKTQGHIKIEIPAEVKGTTDSAKKEEEWQKKIEMCLKLRQRYEERQQNWKNFRLAEKQRRIDKKLQEERDRLMTTIRSSQEKRKYFQEKFQYTMSVRSCHQAAAVIQRAYRRAKEREERRKKEEEIKRKAEKMRQTKSATVIQRSWRSYKEWKDFERAHLHSIVTSPVILLPHRFPLPEIRNKSYERGTIISGDTRRRKLNMTQQSGFKIFKPLPSSQSHTRPSSKPFAIETVDYTKLSPRMKTMVQTWPWSRCVISFTDINKQSKQSNKVQQIENRIKLPQLT